MNTLALIAILFPALSLSVGGLAKLSGRSFATWTRRSLALSPVYALAWLALSVTFHGAK